MRELENVIEQALVFAEGERIDVGALPAMRARRARRTTRWRCPGGEMTLPDLLEDLERQLIQAPTTRAAG